MSDIKIEKISSTGNSKNSKDNSQIVPSTDINDSSLGSFLSGNKTSVEANSLNSSADNIFGSNKKETFGSFPTFEFGSVGGVLYKQLNDDKNNDNKSQILSEIKSINDKNVKQIFQSYSDGLTRGDLVADILRSSKFNSEEKLEAMNHIFSQTISNDENDKAYIEDIKKQLKNLLTKEKFEKLNYLDINRISAFHEQLMQRKNINENNSLTTPNGKIDESFKQGETGDCWLLAGIESMSLTPKGKKILDSSIQIDENKNIVVNLQGVGKKYVITPERLKGANNYIKAGDADVRAIEIAVNDYVMENPMLGKVDLNGNSLNYAYNLLAGHDKGSLEFITKISDKELSELEKNPENISATTSCNKPIPSDIKATANGQNVQLLNFHAYAIGSADDKNIYLVDPYNSDKKIIMSKEDYLKTFDTLEMYIWK